jgi:hypothetical protein
VPTVTAIPCGPPGSWVRAHVVQRGDTLFRIATSYGVTYPQLQRANCMGSSTTIYTGQRLWVPNIPPRTVPPSATTTIPDFPTHTPPPAVTTEPPTDTSVPPTTPPAPATTQPPPPPTDTPITPPPPG